MVFVEKRLHFCHKIRDEDTAESVLGCQPRVVQYSQIDSIGVNGDKKGLHWHQWYDWYQ